MTPAHIRSIACVVALWLALASVGRARTGADYSVMPEHSIVSFTIVKWMVLRETGRFTRFSGAIRYDPARPAESSVAFDIEAASIDTGIEMRDSVLRSDDFFDVARFPTWRFRSAAVRDEGEGRLTVDGDLTIRGVTRRMRIPVSALGVNRIDGVGEISGFETKFAVDRTAFGVNGTRWSGGRLSLGQDVDIELRVAARAATTVE